MAKSKTVAIIEPLIEDVIEDEAAIEDGIEEADSFSVAIPTVKAPVNPSGVAHLLTKLEGDAANAGVSLETIVQVALVDRLSKIEVELGVISSTLARLVKVQEARNE